MFIPSVGPGYDDTRIRPWNGVNRRPRESGAYYRSMWESAIRESVEVVSLTSFNEWGEGTQIESVQPFTTATGEQLQDYGDGGNNFYLELTRTMVDQFKGQATAAAEQQTQAEQPNVHHEL